MLRQLFPIATSGSRLLTRPCQRSFKLALPVLSPLNYTSTYVARNANSISDEVSSPAIGNAPGTSDLLAQQLRKGSSSSRVLELISMHQSVMNNNHLLLALESLYNFKKTQEVDLYMLQDFPFQTFCKRLQRKARFFETDEVVSILKYLSFLELSSKSMVMQTFFQMIRHQLNDMTFQQVLYMDFLLKKQESTPLTEALKMALPMVLENQLDLQLDRQNVKELVELFSYAAENNLSHKTLQSLSTIIINSREPLDFNLAVKILWGLIKTNKATHLYTELFSHALTSITPNLDKIHLTRLVSLISGLIKKHLYTNDFLQSVCDKAVEDTPSLPVMHTLVGSLNYIAFVHLPLLETAAELISRNPEFFHNPKMSVFTFISAFSIANFQPRHSETAFSILMDCHDQFHLYCKKSPELFLKLALHCIALNCYPSSVLDVVYEERFIERIEKRLGDRAVQPGKRVAVLKDLLLLHQASVLHRDRIELPDFLRGEAIALAREQTVDITLLDALERGLGGSQYVLKGMLTNAGVFIDYFLVLRKGNYPMALSGLLSGQLKGTGNLQAVQCVEDIEVPSDSKKVAVLVLAQSSLANNAARITGVAHLPARILAHEGYTPISVLLPVWEQLPDYERIPYIMRLIKEEVGEQRAAEA